MISGESIKYSLNHLKKRKGRSFLTIFSILVGIATIFIFVSFGYGLYNYIDELSSASAADKVLIMPSSAGGIEAPEGVTLNESDIHSITRAAGVYEATGVYFKAALVKQNKDQKYVSLISIDPTTDILIESYNIKIEQGRELRQGDTKQVLLGYNYLIPNKILPKPYELNDNIEVNGVDLKVAGFLGSIGNPQDDSQIYITNDQFESMYPEEDSYVEIFARVDKDNVEKAVENIERNLRKSRDVEKGKEDFTVQSFTELVESFSMALDIVIGFIILIALISVIVSTINTANTMITSVLERYREIGILKAVGAKNHEVLKIFLFESSFLGFIAGILGCILGWALSSLGGFILQNLGWGFLKPYFSVWLFVGLILFATITGAISGVIPAVKASKISTVKALRYE